MNLDDLLEKYKKWIGFFLVFLILISGGILLFSSRKKDSSPIIITEEENKQIEKEGAKSEIVVDVAGSVVNPGIYKFSEDARIGQAIEKAGGFSKVADQEYIAKSLNQASLLSDGQKIYIPKKGEDAESDKSKEAVVSGVETSKKININTASAALLDSLPGIGEVRSQKIIEGRPYKDISELLTRKIIPRNVYEDIKEKISLN